MSYAIQLIRFDSSETYSVYSPLQCTHVSHNYVSYGYFEDVFNYLGYIPS